MNKYALNILWIIIDKVLVLLGGLIVTVIVARYLGPEDYGKIALGIALGGLPLAISQWGGNHTVFNMSAKKGKLGSRLTQATEWLRVVLFLTSWTLMSIVLYFSGYKNDIWTLMLSSLSSIFLGMDVYQFYYNATLKSKINANSSVISKIVSICLRLAFVFFKLEAYFFIIPYFINNIIVYFIRKKMIDKDRLSKRKRKVYLISYIAYGKYFALTAVCTFIYSRVGDLLLASCSDFSDLASFNLGMAFAHAWTFIPISVGTSLFCVPINENETEKKLKGFAFTLLLMTVVSIPILIFIVFFGGSIVDLLLGSKYEDVKEILPLLSLATYFSSIGVFSSRVIGSLNGGAAYLFKKVIFSSIVSLIINYYLITEFGLMGAAYAMVLVEFLNCTFFNYFYKKNYLAKVHCKVIFSFSYYKNYL